jgi:ribosomal protein S8
MMDIVIDDVNYKQVTQAMYENVKSNQHRLDTMEPMLKTMSHQVDRLNTLLVDNGYAKAVETSAHDIKQMRGEFNTYLLTREQSCPTLKKINEQKYLEKEKKHWSATVIKVVAAGIGAVSTLIIIFEKIFS